MTTSTSVSVFSRVVETALRNPADAQRIGDYAKERAMWHLGRSAFDVALRWQSTSKAVEATYGIGTTLAAVAALRFAADEIVNQLTDGMTAEERSAFDDTLTSISVDGDYVIELMASSIQRTAPSTKKTGSKSSVRMTDGSRIPTQYVLAAAFADYAVGTSLTVAQIHKAYVGSPRYISGHNPGGAPAAKLTKELGLPADQRTLVGVEPVKLNGVLHARKTADVPFPQKD